MKKFYLLLCIITQQVLSQQIAPSTTDLMVQYFSHIQQDSVIPGVNEEMENIIRNHTSEESVNLHSSFFITVLFNTVGFKYSYLDARFNEDSLTLFNEVRCNDSSVNDILFSMIDYPCYAQKSYYACRTFAREPKEIELNDRGLNNSDNLTYSVIKRMYEYPNFTEFDNRSYEIKQRVRNIRWSNVEPYSALDSIKLLSLIPLRETEQERILTALHKFSEANEDVIIDEWIYARLGDTVSEDNFIKAFLEVTPSHTLDLDSFNKMITHISFIDNEKSTNALLSQFLRFEHSRFSKSRYYFMEGLDRNFRDIDSYDNYFQFYISSLSESKELQDAVFAEYLKWISSTFDLDQTIL